MLARKAPRPAYSVLGHGRDDAIVLPPWQHVAPPLPRRPGADRCDEASRHRRRRLHRLHLRPPPPRGAARRPDRRPRQAHLRRPAREPRDGADAGASTSSRATSPIREAVAGAIDGLRRGRQLRRRVPRRPLDRGPRRLHPDRRLRHLRPARGGPRRRHPPPADLHRRGLRLDRGGLVHRGVADRALVALLGLEGGRRPDRRRLPPHLRRRRADRPRLEQLRARASTPRS